MMQNLITISPDIQSGVPVFAGTRVPIKNFFDYIKGGDTTEEFLHDFPSVSEAQVRTLLDIVEQFFSFNPNPSYETAA